MNRQSDVMVFGRQGLISAVIIMVALVASGHCETAGMTLLLQQSPFDGGVITPSPGVYLYAQDTEVALVAIPKPGFQFVCWLGDVGDSTANRTITYLNEPKIIIAVFERCQYEDVYGSGSKSGVVTVPTGGGGGSISYVGEEEGGGYIPEPTPEPDPVPDPVPDPEPIPEPVTILLLGSGSLLLLRNRRA